MTDGGELGRVFYYLDKKPGETVSKTVLDTVISEATDADTADVLDMAVKEGLLENGDGRAYTVTERAVGEPGHAVEPDETGTNPRPDASESDEDGGLPDFRDVYEEAAKRADRRTWEYVETDAVRDVLDEHDLGTLDVDELAQSGWLTSDAGLYYPSGDEPRVEEFRRFHELLTRDTPEGYTPHYFRVAPAAKAPATEHGSWKDDENRLTFDEAVSWMNDAGNIGIAGTPDDPLVNVDIDDEEETTPEDLPATLRARSRSRGGFHAWYFDEDGGMPNVPTDEAGEIRTSWQYVVAPGSFVASARDEIPEDELDDAGYYTVEQEDPVASVTFDDMPDVFHDVHEKKKDQRAKEEETPTVPNVDPDDLDEGVKLMDITAGDVVADQGGDTTGDRFAALWHTSTTGTNMSLSDKGRIQCWRHNVAHGGLQALAALSEADGAPDCDDVGTGHKNSNAGACLLRGDPALIWYAWHGAKTETNLDAGKIPRRALRHVARERTDWDGELVEKANSDGEVFEGLPSEVYNKALDHVEEKHGLDTGRERLPEDDDTPDDPVTDGMPETVSKAGVKHAAGLGEDDSISDLDDREKAACVWEVMNQSAGFNVRVRRDNDTLWAYDDGVWVPEGERTLRHGARLALGAMNYGDNVLNELKSQVRSDLTAETEAGEFGVERGKIAVRNGLLDLDEAAEGAGYDALRELRPEDYALTRLPVEYDPAVGYDEWHDLVHEWAEPGRADALQEYVGYCLEVGAMPIHRALLLVGGGANGKSTLLSVVRALLGEDNITSTELQTLANERDAVADFYGALANIDDDLSSRGLGKGIGMFKKMVAGDEVRARRLYKDAFEFEATGKHLYAANEVPDVSNDVSDDDEAFWRRWLIVEFPRHYSRDERDPGLRDRWTTDEALSAVLNWAIDGRRRLLNQGHFTGEYVSTLEKRDRWRSWGDSLDEFLNDHVEHAEDADNVSTSYAYERYTAWCRENDKDPRGQRKFTTELRDADVNVGYARSVRATDTSGNPNGFKFLGFSDDVPQASEDERDEGQEGISEFDGS
jgi:putative DNA primase/helicase